MLKKLSGLFSSFPIPPPLFPSSDEHTRYIEFGDKLRQQSEDEIEDRDTYFNLSQEAREFGFSDVAQQLWQIAREEESHKQRVNIILIGLNLKGLRKRR